MLDTIVKSLFPIDRLDRLEEKVNNLEKQIQELINALSPEKTTKQGTLLGRQHGNREETQHRTDSEIKSRGTDAPIICG